jgi:predicted phosphate transport protein (TIGR00153 family)
VIIDRMVKWLLPRENRFFVYLSSIAKNVDASADVFATFRDAKGPEDFKKIALEMRRREHDTDELAHLLYEELDKTFVTPIDREDLHALTSALDDVLDLMETCAGKIVLFKLPKMTEPMRELVRIGQASAHEVSACISLLQNIDKADDIQVQVIRVNSLENEGDEIYRKALEHLFDTMIDPIELIREKEILDSLETQIDACEDVMDLIRSIVVKNG